MCSEANEQHEFPSKRVSIFLNEPARDYTNFIEYNIEEFYIPYARVKLEKKNYTYVRRLINLERCFAPARAKAFLPL